MRERPILFSGPMVQAILEGRKTMTRRVTRFSNGQNPGTRAERTDHTPWSSNDGFDWQDGFGAIFCPYGQPGDRLWVRETWSIEDDGSSSLGNITDADYHIVYRASEFDGNCDKKLHYSGQLDNDPYIKLYDRQIGEWRPSIFMPRWASRILLEVVSVKAERVQDISAEDAWKEGCPPDWKDNSINWFSYLWDFINVKRGYGWDVNPWCWCITFKILT